MKINYKISNNKDETVLFLHGWGANLNSFNFFYEQLKNNFKCVSIDFPGFGESEELKYSLTVFDYACYVFKLLTKLNISKVTIIAHSFGARVAILLCVFFGLEVSNLIVVGGAGVKPRFNIFNKFKIYKYKVCKWLNKFKVFNFDLSKFGSADYKELNNIQKQTFVNVVNFNEKRYLKNITSKTLLIWGSNDVSTPLYMGKTFNKQIKTSVLKVVKNGTHFCFLEQPNLVLYEIKNFLNVY